MAKELHFLTDEESAILKRMLADFRNQRQNQYGTNEREPDCLTPELYLAKPVTGGTFASKADTDCYIWRRHRPDPPEKIDDLTRLVYNPFSIAVDIGSSPMGFAIVARDKFGQWLLIQADCPPTPTPTPTGSGTPTPTPTSTGTPTPTPTPPPTPTPTPTGTGTPTPTPTGTGPPPTGTPTPTPTSSGTPWECVGGACVELLSGGGTWATKEECLTAGCESWWCVADADVGCAKSTATKICFHGTPEQAAASGFVVCDGPFASEAECAASASCAGAGSAPSSALPGFGPPSPLELPATGVLSPHSALPSPHLEGAPQGGPSATDAAAKTGGVCEDDCERRYRLELAGCAALPPGEGRSSCERAAQYRWYGCLELCYLARTIDPKDRCAARCNATYWGAKANCEKYIGDPKRYAACNKAADDAHNACLKLCYGG